MSEIINTSRNAELLAAKIRRHVVEMTHTGKSSHVGSGLSICDILAVLYGDVLRIDPSNPNWEERDRFILSKGHAGAAVYATLAEIGFFETKELKKHYANGSIFSGHVSHKGVPGVELSTGSLGHGLSVACGMALVGHTLGNKAYNVYCLLSDGECDEGSNWEAILFAAHQKLSNLIAIVDYNKLQSLKSVRETLDLEPFKDKWDAFGWHTQVVDGHDHKALALAFECAKNNSSNPSVIICNTIKGKGVSFMENQVLWHYRSPQGDEYTSALEEIDTEIERCVSDAR